MQHDTSYATLCMDYSRENAQAQGRGDGSIVSSATNYLRRTSIIRAGLGAKRSQDEPDTTNETGKDATIDKTKSFTCGKFLALGRIWFLSFFLPVFPSQVLAFLARDLHPVKEKTDQTIFAGDLCYGGRPKHKNLDD
ncbi:uncharacterized protein UV8b_00506 [Ustilaginoidea virens]|uniref:Uncharacterized protein n=1 Tax=Ustilaginoidea virens TaxID=1159556 RepID=A0A8E5HIW2_USTVR|nr:uncharacterized protein UV8b_00506 [Ustilaginoidea virens]QUC16265.1 hypothetical protein UV8b_00506 [Ustilaginoidea virens]